MRPIIQLALGVVSAGVVLSFLISCDPSYYGRHSHIYGPPYREHQNHFCPTTELRFTGSAGQHVQIKLWNVSGQSMGMIFDQVLDTTGEYVVKFDSVRAIYETILSALGCNVENIYLIPPGAYFYIFNVDGERRKVKAVLL